MKLEKITIKNFRRIGEAEINLASSSFIIGPNNYGKSSVIDAIEALLSLKTEKVSNSDFRIKSDCTQAETIEITGVFSGISPETSLSKGFKGRIISDRFTYRKTYKIDTVKPIIESKTYPYKIKEKFASARTVKDLIDLGINQDELNENLKKQPEDKLPKNWEKDFPDVIEFETEKEPIFEINPGGFSSNVNSKLPKVIRIPSLVNIQEIESCDKKYILGECLSILFEDLLGQTDLAKEIQLRLTDLENRMSPTTEGSLIKKLTLDVNNIINSVFPNCGIEIIPNLQNLIDILKPKYDINLFSNVKTKIDKQGTGLIRTTAFAMLKYHSNLKTEKKIETRPIIVAFEEPEIYLHPAAANLLRETIYALGKSDQIVCNTHSPWMIDLTQEPLSLSKMIYLEDETIGCKNYGLTSIYLNLPQEDKKRVKMLQLFDDELSRVFFAERVIIVEGDTELLAIKNTLYLLPENLRREVLAKSQIVRARGKASIISLVKYLQDLDIKPFVLHDRDQGIPGAELFNKPIFDAVNDASRIRTNEENIEDTLGYPVPNSDKPFQAYTFTSNWKSISDIPEAWVSIFEFLFDVKL